MEAPCVPVMLPGERSRWRHGDFCHRRSHHRDGPMPARTVDAPSFERRPQEREHGSLQHGSCVTHSNEAFSASCCCWGQVFLASNSEIGSTSARTPRLARRPREPARMCSPQRLGIVFDGDSGKTIRTGWRARHHIPPATGAMHALYICAHGGVIYI